MSSRCSCKSNSVVKLLGGRGAIECVVVLVGVASRLFNKVKIFVLPGVPLSGGPIPGFVLERVSC